MVYRGSEYDWEVRWAVNFRPPIPPQGVLRNASTFASANHHTQNAATVAESAGKCSRRYFGAEAGF